MPPGELAGKSLLQLCVPPEEPAQSVILRDSGCKELLRHKWIIYRIQLLKSASVN